VRCAPGILSVTLHWLQEFLHLLLRLAAGRTGQPSAAILNSRRLSSTPESGARAGYDGHKRRKGSKAHAGVDTLGHLLALLVAPAHEQDRALVAASADLGGWHRPFVMCSYQARPFVSATDDGNIISIH